MSGGDFPPHPQGEGASAPKKPQSQLLGALVTFVLVAAAVFAITAFWIPGFLLDKSSPPPSQSAPSSPTADPDVAPVKAASGRVVQAFNHHDRAAMQKLMCKGSMNIVQSAPPGGRLAPKGDPQVDDSTARVPMTLTIKGKPRAGAVTFAKESGHWCLKAGH